MRGSAVTAILAEVAVTTPTPITVDGANRLRLRRKPPGSQSPRDGRQFGNVGFEIHSLATRAAIDRDDTAELG